jgi:hypothetical protein
MAKHQYTKIGEHDGHSVAVATDSLGSQIIYGGSNDKLSVHLLSIDLGSHEIACNVAKMVVENGPNATTWQASIGSRENFLDMLLRDYETRGTRTRSLLNDSKIS